MGIPVHHSVSIVLKIVLSLSLQKHTCQADEHWCSPQTLQHAVDELTVRVVYIVHDFSTFALPLDDLRLVCKDQASGSAPCSLAPSWLMLN